MNWDVVTLPSFAEVPNTTTQVDGGADILTTTSRHKNEAFAVLTALLSDEAQQQIATIGNTSILKDNKINEQFFGKSQAILENRNRLAFVKNQAAKPPQFITKYDGTARGILRSQFTKYMTGSTDINTVLRDAED